MSELSYDDLIARGVSALAAVILKPGHQNQDHFNRIATQAVLLRSGRSDGMASRRDIVDVTFQIYEGLRDELKSRLVNSTVLDKLGISREEFERGLSPVMATMITREELEQSFDDDA
jgi:hypothetical protein